MKVKPSVFVIDDSAVVRQCLASLFESEPDLRYIGSAPDPLFALQKMEKDWPDVIVLDLEMPRMDGITFLKKIMLKRPTPVVVCSTLTEQGADATLQALSAGALDIITKPRLGLKDFLESSSSHTLRVVKAAANARISKSLTATIRAPLSNSNTLHSATELKRNLPNRRDPTLTRTTDFMVACGTSTGGTQALEHLLIQLDETCPGMVIVQHMPEKFTAAFAQRLNLKCRCEVLEAKDGDRVIPGRVLIAPGGRHMQVRRNGAQYCATIMDGPPVNRHKPSVDVLFKSVAKAVGPNALGIIMTGMGNDGAQGLLAMREVGARTIAQDRESCVVFGMPKEAIELGAVCQIASLDEIADLLANHRGVARRV